MLRLYRHLDHLDGLSAHVAELVRACWELGGRPEIIFNQLTDQDKKNMKFKDLGTEEYQGKLCHKYYYEQKQLVKSKVTAWVWEGLILKQEIKQTFGSTVIELVELKENTSVPASTFAVPKGK